MGDILLVRGVDEQVSSMISAESRIWFDSHRALYATFNFTTGCCVVTNATCLTKSGRGPRNSSRLRARIFRLLLALALSTMQVTLRYCSVPPQFSGREPWWWSDASLLSSPSTREDLRLFKVPPCRKGPIHLQTFMSSPGLEPSTYGIAVSVANHYTG
ncbi:hypothetical protein TNCV_1988381 [Trichonephila clavipes]|nr:hypothetical protein TNCV_1988381 [Trichonephila clavipes]